MDTQQRSTYDDSTIQYNTNNPSLSWEQLLKITNTKTNALFVLFVVMFPWIMYALYRSSYIILKPSLNSPSIHINIKNKQEVMHHFNAPNICETNHWSILGSSLNELPYCSNEQQDQKSTVSCKPMCSNEHFSFGAFCFLVFALYEQPHSHIPCLVQGMAPHPIEVSLCIVQSHLAQCTSYTSHHFM